MSVAVIVGVLGLWVDGAAHIMGQDPRFADKKPSLFRPWVWMEWYKIGRQDNQVLPNPIWLVARQIDYLMPWYNPVKEANTQDAVNYLNNSTAAKLRFTTSCISIAIKKQESSLLFYFLNRINLIQLLLA